MNPAIIMFWNRKIGKTNLKNIQFWKTYHPLWISRPSSKIFERWLLSLDDAVRNAVIIYRSTWQIIISYYCAVILLMKHGIRTGKNATLGMGRSLQTPNKGRNANGMISNAGERLTHSLYREKKQINIFLINNKLYYILY